MPEKPFVINTSTPTQQARIRLVEMLDQDLDFHNEGSLYASHNYHSFPAKFPPQLPRLFIDGLTQPGDVILDPMMGSGTTVVEAILAERRAIGFDIDPLSVLLSRVKVTALDKMEVAQIGTQILERATMATQTPRQLEEQLESAWDTKTKEFVNYWFAHETQVELLALVNEIQNVTHHGIRDFLQIVFSSIIITKSGGVSLAFDLAHTRPHLAKIAYSTTGKLLLGSENLNSDSSRVKFLTKILRSPLDEFKKRLERNLASLPSISNRAFPPEVQYGDAQQIPLHDASVDLIVTSPPYISNAIDYMRAHKFSLVWFGYPISELSRARQQYIGGESTTDVAFAYLPSATQRLVAKIAEEDEKKSLAVHRYYSEMTRVLGEIYRVLKPGRVAVMVVGTSIVKGIDTEINACLSEIGQSVGFEVPAVGTRNLDRDRRMLPASMKVDRTSQIQQRMHEEFVIGFYKS
jgi:DNA modification methylase